MRSFGAAAALAASLAVVSTPARAHAQEGAKGIDVAKYQGRIDWPTVKSSGISFAIARVSDGLRSRDPRFKENWQGMKAAGIIRGVYQYFRPAQDAVAQADLLLSEVGQLEKGDLPPFLDVEAADGCSNEKMQSQIAAWINHVKSKTNVTPIIYTAPGFWNQHVNAAPPAGAQLWVAHWKTSSPKIPTGWSNWVIWQYTDSLKVPGINAEAADGDVFHGSVDDLKKFAETNGAQGAGTGTVTTPTMPSGTGTSTGPGSNAGNPTYSGPVGNLLDNNNGGPAQPPAATHPPTMDPVNEMPKDAKLFDIWMDKYVRMVFRQLVDRELPDAADTPEKAYEEFKKAGLATDGAEGVKKCSVVFYKDHYALANGDGKTVVATTRGPDGRPVKDEKDAVDPGQPIGTPLGWAGPAAVK